MGGEVPVLPWHGGLEGASYENLGAAGHESCPAGAVSAGQGVPQLGRLARAGGTGEWVESQVTESRRGRP